MLIMLFYSKCIKWKYIFSVIYNMLKNLEFNLGNLVSSSNIHRKSKHWAVWASELLMLWALTVCLEITLEGKCMCRPYYQ